MAFDIELAVAELDAAGGDGMDYSVLRERYPELAFLFDKLEGPDADEVDDLNDRLTRVEHQMIKEEEKACGLLDVMALVRDQLIRAQGLMEEGGGAEYLIADAVAKLDIEITTKGETSG